MIIGITGNIACGKSMVVNYLIEKKYFVIDSDLIVKSLWEDRDFIRQAGQLLNVELIDNSNYKRIVANLVFNDEDKRLKLNSLIHPLVRKEILTKIEKSNEEYIFIDVPLLFESHFDELCDIIILVKTSREIQIERLKKRNNSTEEESLLIINKQIPLSIQEKKSDFIINNSGSIEKLYEMIEDIIKKMEEEHGTIRNKRSRK